jgi:hypothetical protein
MRERYDGDHVAMGRISASPNDKPAKFPLEAGYPKHLCVQALEGDRSLLRPLPKKNVIFLRSSPWGCRLRLAFL